MVERKEELDAIFASLADPTRRDILRRVARRELSVSEIAAPYRRRMSLAAVAKHLSVLEAASLVVKTRHGREQRVRLAPASLKRASAFMDRYRAFWEKRLDRLEGFLNSK